MNWKKYQALINKDAKMLILATLISLTIVGFATLRTQSSSKSTSGEGQLAGVDTFIPRGFVLVPIEVQNYEALDSILGKYGVVDLFRNRADGGQLIAKNVRLMRAPQNPSRFAVLIAETQASEILKYQGLVFVTLKPPGQNGTEIVNNKMNKGIQKRRILFEGD